MTLDNKGNDTNRHHGRKVDYIDHNGYAQRNERMKGWTNGRTNERVSERASEGTNE